MRNTFDRAGHADDSLFRLPEAKVGYVDMQKAIQSTSAGKKSQNRA